MTRSAAATASKLHNRPKKPHKNGPKRHKNASISHNSTAKLEFRALSALKVHERNARTHPEAQIAQIAAAIERWGFAGAILADDKGIVAGHGRKLALEALFAAGKTVRMAGGGEIPKNHAPVLDVTGWSDVDRRAFIIADNRIAENAGWDKALLVLEAADLKLGGFDMSLLGFEESELRALARRKIIDGADPDDIPAVPKKPISRAGDLWLLGEHRVYCGDSTSKSDVAACLAGARPHLMVTDPPYGVDYDPSWRAKLSTQKPGTSLGVVHNDDRADWREAWALFPGEVAYIWHGALHAGEVAESLDAVGLEIRSQIIWVKQGFVFGRSDYHWQHEPCWYAVKKGGKGHWAADRKQTTIWEIQNLNKIKGGNKDEQLTGHSTQKPVECMRRPIINNSKPGDPVYDPFLGSGTTLIAAEMEARRCLGLELNPAYCDVIVERWEKFTGGKAKRERRKAAV